MAKYQITTRIRTSDLDQFDRLKPYAYLDYFQDVAGFQAKWLGIGYEQTISRNIAWILMKNQVNIYEYPLPYEELTITTYPAGKSRIDFIRDYEVHNHEDKLIARGTSQWCLVNTVTKKIIRTSEIDFSDELIEKSFYEEKIPKINFPNFDELTEVYRYRTRRSDLDHYHHTNNARYGEILFNAFDIKNHFVKELIINYHNETPLGETLIIMGKQEEKADELIISGVGVNSNQQVNFSFQIKCDL